MAKRVFFILTLCFLAMVCACSASTQRCEKFEPLPKQMSKVSLATDQANFNIGSDSYCWISDIEHVYFVKSGKNYLAQPDGGYYLTGAVVKGQKYFELFPYHYYDKEEEEHFGQKINYKLIAKNNNAFDVILEIQGQGTTVDWDHYKTWQGALNGDNKRVIVIKPDQTVDIWAQNALEGGLPWSGIVLGYASADIWVADYAYLGSDPGIEKASPMPDLSQPPYNWPSFTRGTTEWNAVEIDFFPKFQTTGGRVDLDKVENKIYQFAIAASPGGPGNNPCDYSVVKNTFSQDQYYVLDPLSQKSHKFFGGNYPVMYKIKLALANTTLSSKRVSLYVSSNDNLNVDTIAGLWKEGVFTWARVPGVEKNSNWKVYSVDIAPGQLDDSKLLLVPLGSRWGGMVCHLVISDLK